MRDISNPILSMNAHRRNVKVQCKPNRSGRGYGPPGYVPAQGHRHGLLVGTGRGGGGWGNRRQVANLPPKYPKNRKRYRIWALSFSNLEGTSPLKFFTGGDAYPPSPPLSTPMAMALLLATSLPPRLLGVPPNSLIRHPSAPPPSPLRPTEPARRSGSLRINCPGNFPVTLVQGRHIRKS